MKRVIGTVLIMVTAGVCIRLGLWQLDRLSERKAINAVMAQRSALPRVDLLSLPDSETLPHRVVLASGIFDHTRQIVRVGRPANGIPGVVIVTPLLLTDDRAVLVERGWAPSADARTVALAMLDEPGSITVTGKLVESTLWPIPESATWPLYIPAVRPESVQPRYPYQLFPLILRRDEAPRHASGAVFRPVPQFPAGNGPHLSYSIQWFSFATIALVGGWFLLYRSSPGKSRLGHHH